MMQSPSRVVGSFAPLDLVGGGRSGYARHSRARPCPGSVAHLPCRHPILAIHHPPPLAGVVYPLAHDVPTRILPPSELWVYRYDGASAEFPAARRSFTATARALYQ